MSNISVTNWSYSAVNLKKYQRTKEILKGDMEFWNKTNNQLEAIEGFFK